MEAKRGQNRHAELPEPANLSRIFMVEEENFEGALTLLPENDFQDREICKEEVALEL